MASGVLIGSGKHFFWNLDANVGTGQPNNPDDVQLVQLAYFCMAANRLAIDSTLMALAGNVVPGAPYSGLANEPLSLCIRRHQQVRGGIVDGRVSRITNPTGNFGSGTWMLLPLNNHIAINMGALWPRLRDHPRCPSPLDFMSNTELIFPNAPPKFHV